MRTFALQKLIALTLIVFLSEACCLLCCGVTVMASHHSCPLEKTAHCDKKAEETGTFLVREGQTRTNFCPFISKRSELGKSVVFDGKTVNSASAVTALPKFTVVARKFSPPPSYRSTIRNRGSTYLTNCVFRI